MSDYELTPGDTAAMRAEGDDWRLYLRGEIAKGRARREAKPEPRAPAPPPGRRPGAWPPGTRPPDPPPPVHPAEVQRAVQEYRDWLLADRPRITTNCECHNCQLLEGRNR